MTTALFLGRFQPFHRGHLHAITHIGKTYEVIIGIGSADTVHSLDNPLTAEERRTILEHCLDTPRLTTVNDHPDNAVWTDMVEDRLDFDVVVSGNDLVQRLFRERGYTVEEPDYKRPEEFSGTEVRRRVVAGEEWKQLVPDCCRDVLDNIGFVERLRGIVAAE